MALDRRLRSRLPIVPHALVRQSLQVGGLILFSRNFESAPQLRTLIEDVHGLREPRLLVAVDQEGGRVQRFRGEFTALPAMSALGEVYDEDPDEGLALAAECAWLMASELRAARQGLPMGRHGIRNFRKWLGWASYRFAAWVNPEVDDPW